MVWLYNGKERIRLLGGIMMYPKIGIRRVIDGRRLGVRESLEDQIMEMAKKTAEFLSANLRYPDGSPVECVISETAIGGVNEAARCAEYFRQQNVGVSLTVTTSWCYGTEVIDVDPTIPKAIWGFNGTERPGAVYLAAALAAHNQMGLPTFGIYGHDVRDKDDLTIPEDVAEKLLRFARAGLAVAMMKGNSYLAIGNVSMGIAGSMVNFDILRKYFGMRAEFVDMSELIRRMNLGIYDHEEFEKAIAWVRANRVIGKDNNKNKFSDAEKEQQWETCVKMMMIMRDLMVGNPKLAEMGYVEEAEGHHAIAGGFQGQRQWTDFMPNGDFAEAMLNSSFDWNGIRAPYVVATENDHMNGIPMLMGKLLTNTAQVFVDVRTYWSPDAIKRVTGWTPEGAAKNGLIHLLNSGAASLDATGQMKDANGNPVMKPFWEITQEDVDACMKNTRWCPANVEYFRGGGFSSEFESKGGMPVTMSRLNNVKGVGLVLQIAEGYTVEIPENVSTILKDRTDPTWPTTWFAPRLTGEGLFTDVYNVMNAWGANHGVFSYGHIGADLITMASMLRIPVAMHNVPREKIFRPSAWNMFGTADLESADFRACQTYGTLY